MSKYAHVLSLLPPRRANDSGAPPAPAAPASPPSLSPRERELCERKGIDPKTYAAKKAAIAAKRVVQGRGPAPRKVVPLAAADAPPEDAATAIARLGEALDVLARNVRQGIFEQTHLDLVRRRLDDLIAFGADADTLNARFSALESAFRAEDIAATLAAIAGLADAAGCEVTVPLDPPPNARAARRPVASVDPYTAATVAHMRALDRGDRVAAARALDAMHRLSHLAPEIVASSTR